MTKVLVPFARAVHSADPGAKVVGGSIYGMDLDWWAQFAHAGGFSAVDVVALHDYQWASRWEGSGLVQQIQQLQRMKAAYGAAAKPLWDTESGYQSINAAGGPWAQAGWSVRKLLWEASLGIPSQSFLIEGGWEDWSVIDQYRGVKPAAMALLTLTTVTQGRSFLGFVKTGLSHVYAARFSTRTRGGEGLVALWTDGASVRVPLTSTHAGWDETGAPLSVRSSVVATGSVQYFTFAAGRSPL